MTRRLYRIPGISTQALIMDSVNLDVLKSSAGRTNSIGANLSTQSAGGVPESPPNARRISAVLVGSVAAAKGFLTGAGIV